jgi:DNA-binding transcriptional LysR family regulator
MRLRLRRAWHHDNGASFEHIVRSHMTIQIPPADMLLFASVVREGSFTGAARALGLSKQTVSERLAKLEARLGVRLLERTTRRLRTTEPGAAYYARCAAIAAQIDEANREVQRGHDEPVGLLRVSAPVLYGRRFLAPVVVDYLRRHPAMRVNLVEEGFDLAIRVGELDDSSLTAKRLGDAHSYYVASPAYLAAHGRPTLRTLRSARCIGMKASEAWDIGGASHKVEPALVVNDLETGCEAAIAGLGLARSPSLVCRDAVLDGRLVVLFEDETSATRPVYALYPSRRFLPAKVRVFLEALDRLVAPMQPIVERARGRARATPKARARR